MEAIGRRADGTFVDAADQPIELAFKLYPWEWMFRDKFGAYLSGSATNWLEPPWKAILSNKGILPLLWAMFPRHPNLLPAYFEDDPKAAELGASYVRKPLYSREGANIEIVVGGERDRPRRRPLRRARASCARRWRPCRNSTATTPCSAHGSSPAAPCGLRIREDASPITKNTSRFLPHAIID